MVGKKGSIPVGRLKSLVCSLLVLLACQAPVFAQESSEVVNAGGERQTGLAVNRPIADKWALIVGIGNFADSKIPKLKYATKDARDFYNYLVKDAHFKPDHVRVLLDETATQRRIVSELGSRGLPRLVRPDDLVVIFFSTHGSPSQMDNQGSNFLVAYDSDPDDLYATGVEMQKILNQIKERIGSDRVLLVMDACHSGSISKNAKGLKRSANFDAKALAEGSGQLVICSSLPDEQSWESKRYENGVFTKNLIDGLRSNPSATISSVFEKMSDLVAAEVKEDYPGAKQTPALHSKWTGNDLVISALPSSPRIIPETVVLDLEPDSSALVGRPPVFVAKPKKGGTPLSKPSADDAQKSALVITKDYFGKEEDPRKAYQEACAQQAAHFNEPEYYYRKARVLIQLGNYSKADQELKGLLVDNPNSSAYHLAKAYCNHKLGNKFAAQDEIGMAKFHDPSLPREIVFGD
ncbi:MAG: caspase family protein [Candidatus Obscuribacter sp.]|nr:caspase family protein [Candidatus Obscuribacter sp.]